MDLYKDFSDLKIDETLFKDVKFYVTGSIPDPVLQLLTSGGAKQELHITDFMTHLILGRNPDENDIEVVKDIYERPVVTHNWVTYSAKCGTKLPVLGFSKDSSQLFSGIKVSISQLGVQDARGIWGLINFYGGKFSLDLDQTCTHLIVGNPEGIKYNRALEKTILIVTPDWVTDSVNDGERKDEYCYHPRLLNLSASPVPQLFYKSTTKICCSKRDSKLASEEILSKGSTPDFEQNMEDAIQAGLSSKRPNKQSLFDSLVFSDEDDDVESERKSLFEQLKNTQPWKKSPTPPEVPKTSASLEVDSYPPLPPSPKPFSSVTCAPKSETFTKSCVTSVPKLTTSVSSRSFESLPPYSMASTLSSSLVTTASSVSLEFVSVSSSSKFDQPVSSSATSLPPRSTSASPITSALSTSIISTSEVDISFVPKHHLTQIVAASAGILSSQSTAAFPTTSTSTFPITSHDEPQANPAGKPILRRSLQPANIVQHSVLPSFSSTKPNITISHGSMPQQRQVSAPPTTLYTSSGGISATLGGNLPPTLMQTPTTVPLTQAMTEISSSTSQSPQIISHAASENNLLTSGQLIPTQITSQPSTAVIQQTPATTPNSGLSLTGNVTSMNNPQVTHQTTLPNQSPLPVQLVRHGSVSVIGSQGVSGPPNATLQQPAGAGSQVSLNGGLKAPIPGSMSQVQQQNTNLPLSTSATNMAQQHVHSVAIPGAVLRLPAGVTHQQLQMMSNEERHKFLQNLHKKQIQEQQQRGKPRSGKPITALQYKNVAPGVSGTLRYSSNIRAPQGQSQASAPWPPPPQVRVRPGVMARGDGAYVTDPTSTSSSIGWQSQGVSVQQQQHSPVPQTPAQQQQQQSLPTQQTQLAMQQPQPETQPQQQPQPPPTPTPQQQQFVGSQGGATRVLVGQPAWHHHHQQQSVAAHPTQGLLPQQIQQVQFHAQQLRNHFPHLTQQEAQQFIRNIPSHLREMQSRDDAGKCEYLLGLDANERQVVNHFHQRRHQQQMLQRQQQQAQQQAQLKIGLPQHSPTAWQQQQQPPPPPPPHSGPQFQTLSPHARAIQGRPLPQVYSGQPVVSPGQGSPHMMQGGQLTPHVSPLASPHGHSPIQRSDGAAVLPHPALQGSSVAQNLLNQQNLVNPKTKTALANLLTNRLSGHAPGSVIPQGSPSPIEVATHIVQKPLDPTTGPGSDQMVVYQRRTLANITSSMTNNVRSQAQTGCSSSPTTGLAATSYPRMIPAGQQSTSTQGIAPSGPHYQRPHLFGHDINTMLPRELCMVGCVFYIADYHSDITPTTLNSWKRVIQQHGGEVVCIYDSVRVTHVLCKHQKSPVFQQAVRENKRCITIHWVNDILIRGKMAPPWQAIHLPTPFGTKDKPMKDLLVSVTGFENDERTTIKLMLQLAGAKYTGYFSKRNHLLVCKKFEGVKVTKAREWKRPVVNGMWLSEVLLGQNTPPLVYQGTRYQHFLEDPLRIDPSLASHIFSAWKLPITVSKESVEKAKSVREMALRKRKTDGTLDLECKRARLDGPHLQQLSNAPPSVSHTDGYPAIPKRNFGDPQRLRILLSSMKNKDEMERKALELGAILARTNAEATHLVMGCVGTASRTVKLMCAVSCAHYIVSSQWLNDSHARETWLDEEKYALRLPEFERLFDFRLQETLLKPNRRELLKGLQFYLTPSVVPGRTWLREIIECAGGIIDPKRKSLQEIMERNRDATKYICLATTSDTHLVRDLLHEKLAPVYNSEFVLIGILKQRIDYNFSVFVEDDND